MGGLQVVNLSPHFAGDGEPLATKETTLLVIAMEGKVNDVICYLGCAVASVKSEGGFGVDGTARIVQYLRLSVGKTRSFVASLKPHLGKLRLSTSIAMVQQWLENVNLFAEALVGHVLARCSAELLGSAKDLDSSCPLWGTLMNDGALPEDLLKMQMVDNPAIRSLPAKIRSHAQKLSRVRAVAKELGIAMDSHPTCRDGVRVAMNAFTFAKTTVNVAAAVRVMFEPAHLPSTQESLNMVLAFKSSLPLPLVARLESMKGGVVKAKAEASSGTEPAAKRPKRS